MKKSSLLVLLAGLVVTVSFMIAQAKLFTTKTTESDAVPQETGRLTEINVVKKRNVAIVLYEGVQLLDFAGPGEVFSDAENEQGEPAFNVYTVAASTEAIISQGFVTISPQYSFQNAPKPDIIVFPGGDPANFIKDAKSMAVAKKLALDAEVTMSVCNGARILGQTGLLDNKKITTHWGSIDRLRKEVPTATVVENTRFVDTGQVITTAGISAGIDGSLHLVERLIGKKSAIDTARAMEYNWQPPK